MRSIHKFLLIVLLAASVMVALYVMPVNPSSVLSITVADQSLSRQENHQLSAEEAAHLVDALQGTYENELPEYIAAFHMTLNLKGLLTRRYQVYVTADREVYLKRPLNKRLVRSDNPLFIYTHEAFISLYPQGQMPDVWIIAETKDIFPEVEDRQWQVLKWDNDWHEGMLPPLAAASSQGPVLRSIDNILAFAADPAPDVISLQVTDATGAVVFDDALPDGQLPFLERNGLYRYQLSLSWEDDTKPYRGNYQASFGVLVDLPPIYAVPAEVIQGEMTAFYALHLPQGAKPVLEIDIGVNVHFFPHEDGYVSYLPAPYTTSPGQYRLAYGLEGEPLKETTLTIHPRGFRIQHLSVPSSVVESTQTKAANEQYALYFPPARATSVGERYYTEPFVIPVRGTLTTEFGQIRYVNKAPASSRHSGLDIAAPTGTPIVATNRGRVTLAMNLILTGNTLVIDHGQGLFSIHYHMHTIVVEAGEIVERGQTVGTVGTTGFSTGPHLHFMLSYYWHNLEPGYFLVGEPITFDNYRKHLGPN